MRVALHDSTRGGGDGSAGSSGASGDAGGGGEDADEFTLRDLSGRSLKDTGAKHASIAPFYAKLVILPRQARGKHRENSKKMRFLQMAVVGRKVVSVAQRRCLA